MVFNADKVVEYCFACIRCLTTSVGTLTIHATLKSIKKIINK